MNTTDDPPSSAPPLSSSRIWDRLLAPEMITALAALVMGLCAIAVALYQAELMRNQQAADVWPYIQIGQSADLGEENSRVRLVVRNAGVGPARVQWMEVRHDGVAHRSWHSLAAALLELETMPTLSFQRTSVSGQVVMAGELVTIFEPYDQPLVSALIASENQRDIRLCYCSIRDDCWIASSLDPRTVLSVRNCSAQNAEDFIN